MFPAMHGHLASYRISQHGHLAAGCATDPNSIFFRRLGAPDAVPHYNMFKKIAPNFFKYVIFKPSKQPEEYILSEA